MLFGDFKEKGYHFKAIVEGSHFLVTISASGIELKSIKIPMMYDPRFGVDVGDKQRLEMITDEIINVLPTPDNFNKQINKKIDKIIEDNK